VGSDSLTCAEDGTGEDIKRRQIKRQISKGKRQKSIRMQSHFYLMSNCHPENRRIKEKTSAALLPFDICLLPFDLGEDL
jgi:hypothetical protein